MRYDFACDACEDVRELWLAVAEATNVHLCETCGGTLRRLYNGFAFHSDEQTVRNMDPLEKQWHLDNKKYLEDHSEDIASGAMKLSKVKGPAEFRPNIRTKGNTHSTGGWEPTK